MKANSDYHGFRDLIVYQKAFALAMDIFEISKSFPKEERYSLTDQVRRSSRSIGANLTEAWPKRRYEKAFVAKLIDSLSEACETIHWLDISKACGYMDERLYNSLSGLSCEIMKMLNSMVKQPEKFCH